MTTIQTERRYWAYEPITLELEEILQQTEDEDAARVAPYLTDIRTAYDREGGALIIHFVAPDGAHYNAALFAVEPDPYTDEEEDEEDDEDLAYTWMVEIQREGEAELVDYESAYHAPTGTEPVLFRDTMAVLVAIAEAVYALSDQDHGSPHSVIGDDEILLEEEI